MKRAEYEQWRDACWLAQEDAIKLRELLDRTQGEEFVSVPRKLLDKVTVDHSLMIGWCIAKAHNELEEEARDE